MSSPPSLRILTLEPQYSELKTLFYNCRTSFKLNPVAQIDLHAYHCRDDSHDYTMLPGLVPDHLVGNASVGGGVSYNRSDAFFTDFTKHNPEDYVLSSSELSLIIANRSSHDVRQYDAKWDPSATPRDRSPSAGMSFVHLMVIPKHKVYNIVSLDDTSLIEEMISHFRSFWSQSYAVQRTAGRIQHAVDIRASEIIKGLQHMQDQTMKAIVSAEFEVMMKDTVQKSTDEMLSRLKSLHPDDFIFGFHATPHASVGHLHMHVLAAASEFRRYSTEAHDWKTIPATAVMEVIDDEKAVNGNMPGGWR